jgi:hypothetical protein
VISEAWVINSPTVVSEIIDGELVVINLEKGSYYCSLGVGAYLWQCLQQGADLAMIEAAVVQAFGVPPGRARADLESFLGQVRLEGLIRPAGPGEATAAAAPVPTGSAYDAPDLKIYSDMQDLLLLDPIHDVSDEGWPTRQVDAAR